MKPKGHGYPFPWWFLPLSFAILPFALLRDWFKGIGKRKGDPHDISGEPDIPGGNRP